MEPQQSTSKLGERPMTRWRREQEDMSPVNKVDRPSTGVGRPQSKVDRPTSRRGIKEDSEYGVSSSLRSATPVRNVLGRPPSASVLSNRVSTASSRISTMSSSMGMARLNTGLPPSTQMSMNTFDRPITQHGIASVRPGTARGLPMSRQIQDKRYYEGLLQLKIRELSQEIVHIKKDIEVQNKERAAFLHLDKRAKELAAELTTLQGELADYNIVVDKMTSNVEKDIIELEARELAQRNESTSVEIENMFEDHQKVKHDILRIEKELEEQKKHTNKLREYMDPELREKFDKLDHEHKELQKTIDTVQKELDALSKEEMRLEEHIALSPLKQEAVKLHMKIMETEDRRDKLKEEEKNKLSPDVERERLLQKIKQDNMDMAAAEAQLSDKKKQVTNAEQELEQLEREMEDNHTEKQAKYTELRKREEVMEQFMSTFEQNKQDELDKLEKLETCIVGHLENISNGLTFDVNLSAGDEIAILNKTGLEGSDLKEKDHSIDGLKKEYIRLQQVLNKMSMLENKLKTESAEISKKMNKKQSELVALEDLEGFKARATEARQQLIVESETLNNEKTIYENKLKTLQSKYDNVKERLSKIDIFPEIETLDKKLDDLKETNKGIENFINKEEERVNYLPLKGQTFTLVDKYNGILKDNLKSMF